MRLNDWKREAERFEDIDKAVLKKLYAETDEPVPCPECEGPMDDSPRYRTCPSCRAQAEADRPRIGEDE